MMKTLLKYEYKRTRGPIGAIFGILTAIVATGMFLVWWDIPVLGEMGLAFAVLALFGMAIAPALYLTFAYWSSSYGKKGYFTQTLPIKGSTIYWSKMIWITIIDFVAVAWALLLGWLLVAISYGFEVVRPSKIWEMLTSALPVGTLAALLFLVVLELLLMPAQLFFFATAGSREPLNGWGIGGPLVVWVVTYFIIQMTALIGMLALPFGLELVDSKSVQFTTFSWGEILASAASDTMNTVPLGFVPVTLIIPLILMWWTARSWNRQTTLV